MLREVPLQRQYTDLHGINQRPAGNLDATVDGRPLESAFYQPRPAIFSASGICETFRPTIGSPRSLLTSARMLAS